ncbi:hypothetical protein N665_12207s0001, partial [Sinapis alba]
FKFRRDLDTIWRELGDGANIGHPGGSDGTDGTDGPCKLKATQTESGLTIGEAKERCAKIGRGTDMRSVPSTVLHPGSSGTCANLGRRFRLAIRKPYPIL